MLSLVLSLNSALWSRSKGAKHCGQPWPQESSRREEGVEVGVYLVHKITVRLKGYKCYKLDCFQNSLYAAFVGFVCEECSNARNIISLSPQPAQAERDANTTSIHEIMVFSPFRMLHEIPEISIRHHCHGKPLQLGGGGGGC